jgi:hypothetical protein
MIGGKPASTLVLFAAMAAVCALWLFTGCGSTSATATNDTPSAATSAASRPAKLPETGSPEFAAMTSLSGQRLVRRPGDRTQALAPAGDRPFDKTFDDIKFTMEVGEAFQRKMLTPAIEAMIGQRIRIRGYILPTAQQRGFKQFVLVRDNQECCFGPGAALVDCIFVEMQPGKTAEFSIRPVAVLGTFAIQEIIGPDGKHLAIYHLDAEEVRR